jgi:hypothetical protein
VQKPPLHNKVVLQYTATNYDGDFIFHTLSPRCRQKKLYVKFKLYREVLNSVDCLAACALIGDWFVNS